MARLSGCTAAILGLQAAILLHLMIVALGLGRLVCRIGNRLCPGRSSLVLPIWSGWVSRNGGRPLFLLIVNRAAGAPQGFVSAGLLVNLTNPKAIIFIGALVPSSSIQQGSRLGNI